MFFVSSHWCAGRVNAAVIFGKKTAAEMLKKYTQTGSKHIWPYMQTQQYDLCGKSTAGKLVCLLAQLKPRTWKILASDKASVKVISMISAFKYPKMTTFVPYLELFTYFQERVRKWERKSVNVTKYIMNKTRNITSSMNIWVTSDQFSYASRLDC